MIDSELNKKLNAIDPQFLSYQEVRFLTYKAVYDYIEKYAYQHELLNTLISLQLCRGFMLGRRENNPYGYRNDGVDRNIYMNHAINIAKVLIDLNPQMTNQEMDMMLSAAILHVLVEKILFPYKGQELIDLFGIDERALEICWINLRNPNASDNEKALYYKRIQENKYALLIKLADRANIAEQFFGGTPQKTTNYIADAKNNFIPMCLYGLSHYPELQNPINLLMSKMINLMNATEIITNKHIARVNALNNEILRLKEDNARLVSIIEELKNE